MASRYRRRWRGRAGAPEFRWRLRGRSIPGRSRGILATPVLRIRPCCAVLQTYRYPWPSSGPLPLAASSALWEAREQLMALISTIEYTGDRKSARRDVRENFRSGMVIEGRSNGLTAGEPEEQATGCDRRPLRVPCRLRILRRQDRGRRKRCRLAFRCDAVEPAG